MALELRNLTSFGLAAAAMSLVLPLAFGGEVSVIDVNSGLDPATESNNKGPDVAVAIPALSWQPNGATADGSPYEWISFNAHTGLDCASFGTCLPNTTVGGTPTAIFTQTFDLPDPYNGGTINIWADDTATVFLGDIEVFAANGTLGPNCAATSIGCIPDAVGQIVISNSCNNANALTTHCVDLGAGSETLTINTYQLGGGAFGVLYEGEITSELVPEPGTYALLGFGLIGLMFASKRLKRRA